MTPELIAYIVPTALLAAAVGYLLCRSHSVAALAVLEQRFDAVQNEADALRTDLNGRIHTLAERDMTVGEQQTELALRAEQLTTLRARQQEAASDLSTTKETLAELQQRHAEQGRQLSARQSELDAEQRRARELRDSQDELKNQLAEQADQTEQVRTQRNELREVLAGTQEALNGERKKTQSQEAAIGQLREDLNAAHQQKAEAEQQRHKLQKDLATREAAWLEKEASFEQRMQQFEEQKQVLKQEFQNLANEILEAKGKAFSEQNKASLDALLNPFKQQITEFKTKVEDIHHKDTQQQAELRTELKQLQAMNKEITEEAHQLATALRGQKKMQGNWGELILENVLDRSGLRKGVDFRREVSITGEDGRGRPDAIVYLPDDKHLIIDAKVSLEAYTRYVNSEDEGERKQALADHVKAVSDRIKELSDRNYYQLPGLNSPEMVFMFVPIESAFVEAFKADESLYQKALEQNVLVATPTTLLTSLNIVRQLWRFEDQNKHTAELAEKAGKVYDKLRLFVESMEGVGKALDKARDSYDKAYGQLVNGRGNLIKQASEFQKLGVSVKAELPTHLTDKADLELTHQQDAEETSAIEASAVIEEVETA